MGRLAEGWKLRQPGGTGTTYYVRFTHAGRQREFSTGTTVAEEAAEYAAQKYAEVVSGRRVARTVSVAFDELIATWLVAYGKSHSAGTTETCAMYARAHWLPFFGDVASLTKDSIDDYALERLGHVTRVTVRKELSALRRFCVWAKLTIDVPGLKKHAHPGHRAPNARKEMAIVLSAAQVALVLAKLPEYGHRHHAGLALPRVRDFLTVLWETGLRQSTLFRLEAPKHYRRGADVLNVTRDIDKAFDSRPLDLSAATRAALDRCTPDVGRIFAPFSLHLLLAKACTDAGVPVISPYDLRHSRLSAWANTPGIALTGVQYLAGHKRLSTTSIYIKPQRDAARAIVLGGIVGGRDANADDASSPRREHQPKQPSAKDGT